MACISVAVVDEVPCVNPFDFTKGGIREIDRLEPELERERTWQRVQKRYRPQEQPRQHEEFGRVGRSRLGAVAGVLRYSVDWTVFRLMMLAVRLVRTVAPVFGANKSP